MDFTTILNGSSGHSACGFARATVASQLAFLVGVAAQRVINPPTDQTTVWDESLKSAMGTDNGLPVRKEYDLDDLIYSYAAAFLSLNKHINTPHPENGRKDEHLVRFLKTPNQIVETSANYRNRNKIQQARATAAMLGVDATARIAAIMQESLKEADSTVKDLETKFVAAIKAQSAESNDDWTDTSVEGLVSAGEDVAARIKESAKMFLDSQKKRLAEGKFVRVDAGIFALAQ